MAEINFFKTLSEKTIQQATTNTLKIICSQLNTHLKYRTVLVGNDVSDADKLVYLSLKKHGKYTIVIKNNKKSFPFLIRWYNYCERNSKINPDAAEDTVNYTAEGSFTNVSIDDSMMGKVVTRFPPEPSGYLHIGHAKAALINNFYAREYKGTLLLRFDDTNPTKENEEFVENIKADLSSLDIHFDKPLTYTSNYFDQLLSFANVMIEKGFAYIDNTPLEQMREERMNGIESKYRNRSVDENLSLWKHMQFEDGGDDLPSCDSLCLRAKIDMNNVNKTLRDPVIYRRNLIPHIRTGTKYKVYPTYDLACPIVDSIEGVTHAMRSSEYFDRNEQYDWMLKALNLPPIKVILFSRLNFIYTLLSKRKLKWFVDNNYVEGWFDPRFPTVQGMLRRGLTVKALHQFIRLLGFSTSEISMDWTKLWGINKKYIDPIAHRYMAVFKKNSVPLILNNFKNTSVINIPLHPVNTSFGTRELYCSENILIEGEDACLLTENEEITLMHWGNIIIKRILKENDKILKIEADLFLEGDFKKTKKKINWISNDVSIQIKIVEFDHLINKPVLEEGDDFLKYIVSKSKYEDITIGDIALKSLKKGDIIQLERRGFFICDEPYKDNQIPTFFFIPDGKSKGHSHLSSQMQYKYT